MKIKMTLTAAAIMLAGNPLSAATPSAEGVEQPAQVEQEVRSGEDARPPAATIYGDSSQISIVMNESEVARQAAKHGETVVKINGPEAFSSSGSFEPGQIPTFTQNFEDGLYHWEAVNVPVIQENVRQELSALRESGDSLKEQELTASYRNQGLLATREEAHANKASGTFRIQDGEVIVSTLKE